MLLIKRNYLLKDTKQLHANIHVIPTGSIEIEIVEKRQRHSAEFDQIRFERNGRVTKLLGTNEMGGKEKQWQLPLDHDDATELEKLIEEASDELEILMRDL